MEDPDRIRLMELNLSRTIDWVGKHDTKASFVMGIATAMLGVLTHEMSQGREAGVLPVVLAGIAAVLLLAVFWFLFRGAFPRTSVARPSEFSSLLFFETVAQLKTDEFHDRIKHLDDETYLRDLGNQYLEVAGIVAVKFQSLRRAYLFLFISLLPWAASIGWIRFLSAASEASK